MDALTDSAEMVRRAEFTLGKAIRKGQAEGTVLTKSLAAKARRARERGEEDTDITGVLSAEQIEPAFYDNTAKDSAISQLSDGVE